ncbi:MAG: isopenicillin N synthase family oxygenase [Saprospiraceae bacterium]|nr:isopenicillin N synthase family oxygenase [Saprospiraceae bacterium]MBL0293639.1 isopenicillin N synthase family oxygenase [Saprospiraceae bacterium]
MSKRAIPLVDLSKFIAGSDADKADFVAQLGNAFHTVGFVGVINHGIPKALINTFYDQSKSFFNRPLDEKLKYQVAGGAGQRGYTSFGTEHAKQSTAGDLKEFFQFGQEVTDGDPIKSMYPENVVVHDQKEFTESGQELYRQFELAGKNLLQAIALFLNLDKHYFDTRIHNGNSILRAIHYPPITSEPNSAIRAEQHEDINLITLLVGASAGGLQILTSENEWMNVVPEGEEIVINVGDMLQRLTNNYLKSTTHRVVNPPKEEWHIPRLSIPFFLHPKADVDLTCLPSCVSDAHPIQYESITAGNYLNERLREIGLIK